MSPDDSPSADLFGTAGIRGPVETLTPERALAVGRAAGVDGAEFVVGRDGRETGPGLAAAVAAGLTSAGATVTRVGRVPTPTLAFASRGRRGVMVTASHNPPEDNGLKLFVDGSEYDADAERRIEARVEAGGEPASWERWGQAHGGAVLRDYRHAVAAYARGHGAPPDDLDVALDCGTGMAGLVVPEVLTDLGAGVRALNAHVDGRFGARPSKPTAETLSELRAFVADGPADLGFGHDGDADRIVLLDDNGEVVHEDTVLAILAEHYTRSSDASDSVVVTTPNASGRIDERVRAAGGHTERVALGALHEGVAAVREDGGARTEVVFAAEPWKHLHPAFGGWIDGVASAALLCRLVAADGLEALREPVTERPYRKESLPCPDERKRPVIEAVERTLPDLFPAATVDTAHGVRIELPDGGWALVRPSGTEPYVRVYAESERVDDLIEAVVAAVEDAI